MRRWLCPWACATVPASARAAAASTLLNVVCLICLSLRRVPSRLSLVGSKACKLRASPLEGGEEPLQARIDPALVGQEVRSRGQVAPDMAGRRMARPVVVEGRALHAADLLRMRAAGVQVA